jgi:hypothetical protein
MKTVIEMAQEANIKQAIETPHLLMVNELERFAELVRADEREACAKVCDDLALPPDVARSDASIWEVATLDCAEAIRARSNT